MEYASISMSSSKKDPSSEASSQTFRIVGNASKSNQRLILGRFVGSKLPTDLTASNASKGHDAWTMKEERLEASGPVVNYTVEKNALSDDYSERAGTCVFVCVFLCVFLCACVFAVVLVGSVVGSRGGCDACLGVLLGTRGCSRCRRALPVPCWCAHPRPR